MGRHSGYAHFCYYLALSFYMGVMDVKASSNRKLAQIKKTFTKFIKQQLEHLSMEHTILSYYTRIPKRTHCLRSCPERFFQGISGFPNFKRKKFGDSFTLGQQQRLSIAQSRKKN
jgi:putative transposase